MARPNRSGSGAWRPQEIHEHANAAGVRMCIEPLNRFETHFVNRGEQALALADAVAPDVGVCLDCFHMNIEEVDLLETIRAIGPRLTDFHVADNNRMACGMGASTGRRSPTLKEVGYDGALTVEFVADRPHAGQPLSRRAETNPVDISPEELQFIIDHGSSLLSGGLLQHARRDLRDDPAPSSERDEDLAGRGAVAPLPDP